jgi:hypothetical protein
MRKLVGSINASVGALEKLFNALLDVSRLDAGVLQPRGSISGWRRSSGACAEHARKPRPGLDPDRSAVRRRGLAAIPRCSSASSRNYVSNAIRYTDAGGSAWPGPSGGQVHIEVTDTGSAFPWPIKEDLRRVLPAETRSAIARRAWG